MIADPPREKSAQNKWLSLKEWRKRLYTEEAVQAVDDLSLVFFPISFVVFNAIYWISVANDM